MSYRSLRVSADRPVCHLQLYRPDAGNSINHELVTELLDALKQHSVDCSIVVLEGLPEVFCVGADFKGIHAGVAGGGQMEDSTAGLLYNLWQELALGPYISVAHVRGQANAGGIGFVAACDMVLADSTARFSLSELLFGLYPACVLPFLVRRVGVQRANYLTVSTQPIDVEKACAWGLVDAWQEKSEVLLQRHLVRLRRLSKDAIVHYKQYLGQLDTTLRDARSLAVGHNHDMHRRPGVIEGIVRFVENGRFPWERD